MNINFETGSARKQKNVFIAGHGGLGDHILCNGIYREYASRHDVCVIPVNKRYLTSMEDMLGDLSNIVLLPCNDDIRDVMVVALRDHFNNLGFNILSLGSFGQNQVKWDNTQFDQIYYDQANVCFNKRWSSFYYPRDTKRELELFDSFDCQPGGYIFLHEDIERGMVINRELIESDLTIISPNTSLQSGRFFDYGYLLENALEIHCIESSFAALAESLQISAKKYAHRYCRWEASRFQRMEFTYRTDWVIYV